jgi:serine protease Do
MNTVAVKRVLWVALAAVVLEYGSARPAWGAENEDLALLRRTSKAFSSVAKKAMPAVVFIKVEKNVEAQVMGRRRFHSQDPSEFFGDEMLRRFFGVPDEEGAAPRRFTQMGQGSGFLVSKDGYILTNNHVVGDADKIRIRLHDGREFDAKRIGTDPKTEVAVIKIEGGPFPYLSPGDSAALDIGEWVIAIGNPFGLAESLTVGVVSAKGRNLGITDYEDFIQTDAAINPGNSGGPLLNLNGDVVGINTAIFSESGGYMGIGFAVPINMAESIRKQLMATGKVTRGYLGIHIQEVTPELAESFGLKDRGGILVADVEKGSPAEKAGVQQADVILKIDDEPVGSVTAFRNKVSEMAPGRTARLAVRRDDKTLDLPARIGELPGEGVSASSDLLEKLGLSVEELTREEARRHGYDLNEGILVTKVDPEGPAAAYGIAPGHLISSVNRRRVTNLAEFKDALAASKSGAVLLRVKDGRMSRYIVLRLGE